MTIVTEIGTVLAETAKKHKTINYSTLCNMFALPPMDGLWNGHPLSEIIEQVDLEDAQKNRPFRSSVLVTKEHHKPGQGLFEALERMKGIKNVKKEHEKIWMDELAAAYAYKW